MTPPHVQTILTEFRHDLDAFYQRIHLAPPYDSVEKALSCLSNLIQTKTADEQQKLTENKTVQWELYQKAMMKGRHCIVRSWVQ